MTPCVHPDIFGYYTVGQKKTYSKLEAIEWSQRYKQELEWHYNDDIYSAFDWSLEPSNSLQELYYSRAKQLRQKYDYLILSYSGGRDSHNMLESFVKQDIYPDEVFSFYNSGETKSNIHYEYNLSARFELKKIQENYPKIKVRVIDIKEWLSSYQNTFYNDQDYLYKMLMKWLSPSNRFEIESHKHIKEYDSLLKLGKKVGTIFGVNKPNIKVQNGKWIFFFSDFHAYLNGSYQLESDYNKGIEGFYWSPDAPLIPIKQSHVIMNFYKNKKENNVMRTLNPDHFHDLIYPSLKHQFYMSTNVNYFAMGSRDWNWINQNRDRWHTFIDYVNKNVDNKWIVGNNFFMNGLVKLTKEYKLN